MSDANQHKRPVTREGIALLIEDCERTSSALSMRPTPFQLEQASNFLVSTVPLALRKLEEQLESAQRVARAADNPAVFDITDDVALYAAHKELAAALDIWRGSNPASSRDVSGPLKDGEPIAGRPDWVWSEAEGRPVFSPARSPDA